MRRIKAFGGKRNNLTSLCLRASIIMFSALLIFYASSALGATISGTVGIEGRQDMSGVLVTAQEVSLSAITSKDGSYSIKNVPSGSHTVIAQKTGCLVEIQSDVVVGNASAIVNFQLIPGDLKIDNQINLLDRIMLTSVWQTSEGDPNWNSMMDIFEDGVINEKDRDLLLSHWREGNPGIKLGSLEVLSEPEGADILINGADTGETTPHIFQGMVSGQYEIMLSIVGYDPRETIARVIPGETAALDPSPFILDNEPPEFADWLQDPADLTEDSQGRLRVLVRVVDRGGSGVEGKIPQFSYRIGSDASFSRYADMTESGATDVWQFDIPEPSESWNAYRSQFVHYRAKIEDIAGNEEESDEQEELIDDINDSPTIRITSVFDTWERGLLTITAEASDTDGTIDKVQFEYSLDNSRWISIGSADTVQPYSVPWDTTEAVREVAQNVWIRTTATDDDNTSQLSNTAKFAIDNQPPVTSHDYDGQWHNENYTISLEADDKNGIGVATISYQLNHGNKQDFPINGQSSAPVLITTESHVNVLEYWSTDELGNEGSHKTLSDIKLDKTAPTFSDWKKNPEDLTEDSAGIIRLSALVSDGDGSGLEGKIPQIDFSIGQVPQYDGFENMLTEDGNIWHFDIFEPSDTWNAHRGQQIYYKIRSADVADNVRESAERSELIDDINDLPLVNITSRFNPWEKGLLSIQAEASDTDGEVIQVQFEYSLDGNTWAPIGAADTAEPFSVDWDTTSAIAQAQSVQLQATATDDSNGSTTHVYSASVGIDNQAPVTLHDYDDQWHTDDFAIVLTVSDGGGIGVSNSNIKYKINDGSEKNMAADGQPWITEEILNQLEYWSVDNLDNEESHHILRNIKLDKTKPVFVDWIQDPANLTEDNTGALQISVRLVDTGGSGLEERVPQFTYRIGRSAQYSPFNDMIKSGADDVWYFDIQEPADSWNEHRGQEVSYKVSVTDVAGNSGESVERKELIDDINDIPIIAITSTFSEWETGLLTIEADASDVDGTITGVQFEYSPNRVVWTPMGTLVTAPPYSTVWDTRTAIPEVAESVWIKATVTDDDGHSTEFTIPRSLGVDNQAPITTEDYNNLWHNTDFSINLTPGDANGIGVTSVSYRFNFGQVQEISMNGRISIPVLITTEGPDNILEYWSTDGLGNAGTHQTLAGIKLDKTAPVFSAWQQDPVDLTEDTTGRFQISVQVTDEGGSGLAGKIPQLDYHIGTETQYNGYENMTGGSWLFNIPEPDDTWDAHQGQNVRYKVRVQDVAGNVTETLAERLELIDSINDAPVVDLTSTFNEWEGDEIIITARASDVDGSAPSVQFEYSVNAIDWMLVGVTSATPPTYSIAWQTKTAIPELERTVWIKAKAIDADDTSVIVEDMISRSFGVDNEASTFGNWTQIPADLDENTNNSLRVKVNVDDGIGSGVERIELAYRISNRLVKPFNLMVKGAGNSWYFDIPEPNNSWDAFRGDTLTYSAVAIDVVGNKSLQTEEQEELIDDINDAPRGVITSTFKDWERGTLTLLASVVDDDGQIAGVQFQYSPDNVNWINIGSTLVSIPYTATWDSIGINMDPNVWLQIVVTDNDNAFTSVPYARSIGIDNAEPTFANWVHTELTEDSNENFFLVEVEIADQGSGINDATVQVNYRIGLSGYTGYTNMRRKLGDVWFYEIFKPSAWSNFAGETFYYKVRATDIAGNLSESAEQKELIEATTGSISGNISPRASWQFGNAKVKAIPQQVGQEVQLPVSATNGSYSITGLRPGLYNLEVTSLGYGTDRSMTNVQVIAGGSSPGHDVTLYKYAVAEINRTQGGSVEYQNAQLREYKLIIDGNALGASGSVLLGVSGREPDRIPNPEVQLLDVITLGFKGKALNAPIQLVMPRPGGIVDGDAIMTFIYDGKASSYRFVDRADISSNDPDITITITPDNVQNFSDENHSFDEHLDQTSDTVFYVVITKFNEPQVASSQLGIRDPVISFGRVTSYTHPNISAGAQAVAVLVPGITSTPDDLVDMIGDLESLNYYDHVLVFNYEADSAIGSSASFFLSELGPLSNQFGGKVDVVAHGMGGLIARSAIVESGDDYVGSLTMLGVPHGGVDITLLKNGFAAHMLKTQSNPAWTYYRRGWQDMLPNSTFLANLKNQSRRPVLTHYYSIATFNSSANDDLASFLSMDFASFPNAEQPLTEASEPISISLPPDGPGFMARTRHVGMLDNNNVRDRVTEFLQGKSQDIQYEKHDGDLIPGNHVELTVFLENTGDETVSDVSAKLSTSNQDIIKPSGAQGIEDDTALFGDIAPGTSESGTFGFEVRQGATFTDTVTFSLLITNSSDSSISTQQFTAPIGGDVIKIDLANRNDPNSEKRVSKDVWPTNPIRLTNDADSSVESEEVMFLEIIMWNKSSGTIPSISMTLSTTDARVVGSDVTGDNEASLVEPNGLTAAWQGTSSPSVIFPGNGTRIATFQFIKSKFQPDVSDQVHFTLEIKSAGVFFGSDEFDVKFGADIAVESIFVDENLVPGGGPLDDGLRIRLKNTTSNTIRDVELKLNSDTNDVDIDRRVDFGQIAANSRSSEEDVEVEIEEDFAGGYVLFSLNIWGDNQQGINQLINTDSFRYYFGKRTQHITHWIDDDDDNDGLAEPGENVELQIVRWNTTDEEAKDVEAMLSATDPQPDPAIDPDLTILDMATSGVGDYGDIAARDINGPGVSVLRSSEMYEFTIANAGDGSGTSTGLTANMLTFNNADWIPHALKDGILNPNTTAGEPQYEFTIFDNGSDWIEIVSLLSMLDPNEGGVADDDPKPGDTFEITMPDSAPFTEFQLEGLLVEFTLDIEEDRDPVTPAETFKMRIGGMVRYLPPVSYDDFLGTISDAVSLDPANNNGNGIPELGETIRIKVTLINITRNERFETDADNVVGTLDVIGPDDEVDILGDDDQDFGDIRDGNRSTATYTFRIQSNHEGNTITFALEIEGDIDGVDEDLGTDIFTIPVGNGQ